MKESLITYKVAKLAKEKGFDIWQLKRYKNNEIENTPHRKYSTRGIIPMDRTQILAPTQALLQKWLRETHHLDVVLGSDWLGYALYVWDRKKGKNVNVGNNIFQTYEEALEAGLEVALNQLL